MAKPGAKGIARIWKAVGYSMEGLCAAWRNEAAFRQEIVLLAAGIPAAVVLGNSGVERAVLAGSLMLVPVVELLNSSVEAVVDLASPDLHELAKRAKDTASAAVLASVVLALASWSLILVPRIWQ